MIVYIACGYELEKGCAIWKVFKNESDAAEFVDRCTKHEKKCPSRRKNESFHDFKERVAKWADKSPAGKGNVSAVYSYSAFEVEE